MLQVLKDILIDNLQGLEDAARRALIDQYLGVSDGLDSNTRLMIALEKGAMARAVIFGTNDEHQLQMMQNEANATGREVREVTAHYYDDFYLPFMEKIADFAVIRRSAEQSIQAAVSYEAAVAAYQAVSEGTDAFISAQYK